MVYIGYAKAHIPSLGIINMVYESDIHTIHNLFLFLYVNGNSKSVTADEITFPLFR